jgi:outer membrane protein assembly factor BamB
VDGLCIAQLGGSKNGAIVAYDLTSGDEKWKLSGEDPAYASPVLITVSGTKLIVAETERAVVAVRVADGKLAWQTPFAAAQRAYNAATPIADGSTIIYSGGGRGTRAVMLEKEGDGFGAKELWSNKDTSVQFNTPVLKNGQLFGLSQTNQFFCMNAANGKTLWTAPAAPAASGGGGRRGGGGGGYGSIVDASSVLLALTPKSELLVLEPSDKEFKQLASYKVADSATYAYPVVSGNRVYVKDQDAVILWTME